MKPPIRRAWTRSALVLLALGLVRAHGRADPPAEPVVFRVEETLTNPTETSVQLVLIPVKATEAFVAYGPDPERPALETPARKAEAGAPLVFTLSRLAPGSEAHYRVHARPAEGDGSFTPRAAHAFRTLHAARGAAFSFAYGADSHITERVLAARCKATPAARLEVANFGHTLANLAASGVDFVIAGGDTFMTHSPNLVSCDRWSKVGKGTVRSATQAERRYATALSPNLWGGITPQIPFLYVLGNHDGEARFGDARGSHGHFPETRALSRAARLRHLPDPTAVYAGSKNGDVFFTFTSGDVRFIVLDVMAGPPDYPARPEDWTLGAEQLAWLEAVLRANDRAFTFVFMEHLVGGRPEIHERAVERSEKLPAYAYGRGSLLSTIDGTARSPFVGEQARLQAWFHEHGVQLVFHAHDHVAVAGEKLAPDGAGEGVVYVMGGQMSGLRPRWGKRARFRAGADYDGDGRPDFESNVNGSLHRGFYRVRVEGGRRAEVAYVVGNATDPALDGTVAFSFEIDRAGHNTLPRPGSAKAH